MNPLYFYVLPSISAISIKLLMVWYGRKMIRASNLWLWSFLGGLFVLNIFELTTFFFPMNADSLAALLMLQLYYMAAIISSAAFLALSLDVARTLKRSYVIGILAFTSLAAIVIAIPGAALGGVESIGYSITRIAGPLYWVLQIHIPVCWLLGAGVLIHVARSRNNSEWFAKRRAVALLIAAAPTIVAVVIIMTLMQIGYRINAAVIVSLTINILLGVLIYTEYENRLFRFLSFVPATSEYKLARYAAEAAYRAHGADMSNAVHYFEQTLIQHALQKSNGNKSAAAELLGISRTTLRRKLAGNDHQE